MKEPTGPSDPADIVADFIARDAVKDVPRIVILMKRLQLAYEESKTKNDGGLAGAITAALAIQDYFVARWPDAIRVFPPVLDSIHILATGAECIPREVNALATRPHASSSESESLFMYRSTSAETYPRTALSLVESRCLVILCELAVRRSLVLLSLSALSVIRI